MKTQIVCLKLWKEHKPAYFDRFDGSAALFGTQAQGKVFDTKGEATRFAQDYLFPRNDEFRLDSVKD